MVYTEQEILRVICDEILHIVGEAGCKQPLSPSTVLPDAGIDSLNLMNLVAAVEQRLQTGPMDVQAWLDEQAELGTCAHSLGSLVKKFGECATRR
ncbi:MAG: acyl carrier protein [Myxococcales bacterium]|nr:acyl carrier protein [Myxococcales bacterium]